MAERGSRSKQKGPGASPAAQEGALSFEQALERLEGIVDLLERGDLPLEEALSAFEEGVSLTRRCAGQLDDAERRIELLVRQGAAWLARPFEEPGEGE